MVLCYQIRDFRWNPISARPGPMSILPSSCFPVAYANLGRPTASFPARTFRPGRFPEQRISGNGAWIRERGRVYVKSESKADEEETSSSESTTSGSFLSLLCPLLKLFSVRNPSLSSLSPFLGLSSFVSLILISLDCLFPGRWPFSATESCSWGYYSNNPLHL